MTALADQRTVTLLGSRTRQGYKVKIRMPNPTQPGASMTLGTLQCSAYQWLTLRELVKAGGHSTGIAITLVTGDVAPQSRSPIPPRPES